MSYELGTCCGPFKSKGPGPTIHTGPHAEQSDCREWNALEKCLHPAKSIVTFRGIEICLMCMMHSQWRTTSVWYKPWTWGTGYYTHLTKPRGYFKSTIDAIPTNIRGKMYGIILEDDK